MDLQDSVTSVHDGHNSMEVMRKIDHVLGGDHTGVDVADQDIQGCHHNQYELLSDNEKSQEILRLVCVYNVLCSSSTCSFSCVFLCYVHMIIFPPCRLSKVLRKRRDVIVLRS
jgi:hypothetical protein